MVKSLIRKSALFAEENSLAKQYSGDPLTSVRPISSVVPSIDALLDKCGIEQFATSQRQWLYSRLGRVNCGYNQSGIVCVVQP